jgi:hypothetical protein
MVGEDKASGSSFQHVNCYSSANLVEWAYEGALLSRGGSGDLGPGRVVERPKVLYNARTKRFVLYMHIDSGNYKEAKVGVAVGDSVCGKYTYLRSFRPMGRQSRDMGVFQDDDGTAYLLSEDVRLSSPRIAADQAARTRPAHLQNVGRLSQRDQRCAHVEGEVRIAGDTQTRPQLLHVQQSLNGVEIERQHLQLGHIGFGPVVAVEDVCAT